MILYLTIYLIGVLFSIAACVLYVRREGELDLGLLLACVLTALISWAGFILIAGNMAEWNKIIWRKK